MELIRGCTRRVLTGRRDALFVCRMSKVCNEHVSDSQTCISCRMKTSKCLCPPGLVLSLSPSSSQTLPQHSDEETGIPTIPLTPMKGFLQTSVLEARVRESLGLPYASPMPEGYPQFKDLASAEEYHERLQKVWPLPEGYPQFKDQASAEAYRDALARVAAMQAEDRKIISESMLSSPSLVNPPTPIKPKSKKRLAGLMSQPEDPSPGSSTPPKKAKPESTLISKELQVPTGRKGLRGFISYLVLLSRTSKSELGPLLNQVLDEAPNQVLIYEQIRLYEFMNGRFM